MSYKITDRFSGIETPGEWKKADDMEHDATCPICGADPGQQCSTEDPENPEMGIETGVHVHAQRGL